MTFFLDDPVDRVKRQKIKEDIMKRLDMLENDFLPQVIDPYIEFLGLKIFIQVMVDKTDVIYDDVHFIEPVSRTLAIANTGQVNLHRRNPQRLNCIFPTRCQ